MILLFCVFGAIDLARMLSSGGGHMLRLLIIEDDVGTSSLLKKGLIEAGHCVELAHDGAEGLGLALSGRFDVVIIDVMLPLVSGWDVLTQLRAVDLQTPVLLLTARDAVEDRVRGLKLGADDYQIKPFSLEELVARVGALSRRLMTPRVGAITYEDLRVDERERRAYRGDKEVDLSTKEYELLELLLRHQGDVLNRGYISENVWGLNVDSESNVVEVNIRRLRRKLDDPFARKIIQTVRGQGYVIR